MSTLSKERIESRLRETDAKQLVITPILSPKQFGDISVDLRLGNQFIVFRMHMGESLNPFVLSDIQLRSLQERRVVRFGHKFVLHPGQLALGCTFEYLQMPSDLEGQVEGRSSWSRVGLQIATATCIEPGFSGVVTLELSNVGTMPLDLFPGVRIAQLVLRDVEPAVKQPYTGRQRKYYRAIGPQFSRLTQDEDAKPFTKG
ncbi:MAG: dCTP deaminase [Verrucomicrobiota bacterium]|jgi:dCTP deaminase